MKHEELEFWMQFALAMAIIALFAIILTELGAPLPSLEPPCLSGS